MDRMWVPPLAIPLFATASKAGYVGTKQLKVFSDSRSMPVQQMMTTRQWRTRCGWWRRFQRATVETSSWMWRTYLINSLSRMRPLIGLMEELCDWALWRKPRQRKRGTTALALGRSSLCPHGQMGLTASGKPSKTPALVRGTSVPDDAGRVIKLMTEVWNVGSTLETFTLSGILFTVSPAGAACRASGAVNARYVVAFRHMVSEGWQARGHPYLLHGVRAPAARELRVMLSTTDALVRSANDAACMAYLREVGALIRKQWAAHPENSDVAAKQALVHLDRISPIHQNWKGACSIPRHGEAADAVQISTNTNLHGRSVCSNSKRTIIHKRSVPTEVTWTSYLHCKLATVFHILLTILILTSYLTACGGQRFLTGCWHG